MCTEDLPDPAHRWDPSEVSTRCVLIDCGSLDMLAEGSITDHDAIAVVRVLEGLYQ